MKKSILIFSVALSILSVTACANMAETDQSEPGISQDMASNTKLPEKPTNRIFEGFIYDVGPRFGPIKKSDLDTIRNFSEFLDPEHAERIVTYKSLSLVILDGQEETDLSETGQSGVLNAAQLKLLQSTDQSTSIMFSAHLMELGGESGQLEPSHWRPHLTIVPEKQAIYVDGIPALKKFLKDSTEEVRKDVDPKKLQAAKLFFTVTKTGTIENMHLDRPSGYPLVDEKMIELIRTTPGVWEPAENVKGEKVAQELVVSFGLMGC